MVNKRPLGGSRSAFSYSSWPSGGEKGPKRSPKGALGPNHWVQGGTQRHQEAPRSTKEAPRRLKKDPGTKSLSAGRHQGGTKEAPGRHQGGTKEAPRNDLHIVVGPRAHPFQRIEGRTSNGRSICFDLTRSGHKARRILYLTLF